MTVQHHYTVSGEGYSFDGQVQRTTGDAEQNLDYVMFPCALCNDSDIQDGEVIGDPTEAAQYVLAQKGGVDVREFRRNNPRVASSNSNAGSHRAHPGPPLGRDVTPRCLVEGGGAWGCHEPRYSPLKVKAQTSNV